MKKPTPDNWTDRFEAMVSRAADTHHAEVSSLARAGQFPPFYLYCRPSTAQADGALFMVPEGTEPDPLWTIGDPQPYRANLTRESVRARVWTAARVLPILQCEDAKGDQP